MLIIKIQNDSTGTEEIGNYQYRVLVNDTVIETGEVTGHVRWMGWRSLLKMLIEASMNKPD